MTIHAPRHKDMDPNHPRNIKKLKLKVDEYVPYPPPECELLHFLYLTDSQKCS